MRRTAYVGSCRAGQASVDIIGIVGNSFALVKESDQLDAAVATHWSG